jgi:hypothetical protein
VPGEAEFRPYLTALREMQLDEAMRPKLMDYLEGRITWREFRKYLDEMEEIRAFT